jgi:hypothetical protein
VGSSNAALNGDLTLTGRVEVQTFLGATTRLLVRESAVSSGDAPATRLLAIDVPSASAGRWPAGSELEVRVPVASSRVIADRTTGGAIVDRSAVALPIVPDVSV